MRTLIAIMALVCGVYAAQAFGLGEGNRFGKLGSISKHAGTPTPPPTCNGTINLSSGCAQPMLGGL